MAIIANHPTSAFDILAGTMTVEEIYQDRQKFSTAVFEVASRDLINMGVTIVSYTLQSISDEVG